MMSNVHIHDIFFPTFHAKVFCRGKLELLDDRTQVCTHFHQSYALPWTILRANRERQEDIFSIYHILWQDDSPGWQLVQVLV